MNKVIWINASAGSGKTKRLIDRILYLLILGAKVDEILCITFTKAAAREMQDRLLKKTEQFIAMTDEEFKSLFRELNIKFLDDEENQNSNMSFKNLVLYAKMLHEKLNLEPVAIKTIHSFAEDILKAFPDDFLLNNSFKILDDYDNDQMLQQSITEFLEKYIKYINRDEEISNQDLNLLDFNSKDDEIKNLRFYRIIRIISDYFDEDQLFEIVKFLRRNLSFFESLDVNSGQIFENYFNQIISPMIPKISDKKLLKSFAEFELEYFFLKKENLIFERFLNSVSSVDSFFEKTQILNDFVYSKDFDQEKFKNFWNLFMTKDGKFRKKIISTKSLEIQKILDEISEVFNSAITSSKSIRTFQISYSLTCFVAEVFKIYQNKKNFENSVDFDDVIDFANKILCTFNIKKIFFRISSNIKHILLDEAQDTNPQQWMIIKNIAKNYFKNIQESDHRAINQNYIENSSLFVVGDIKQSIYSFQGVDVEFFLQMKNFFKTSAKASDKQFDDINLEKSYRTNHVINALVDSVCNSDEEIKIAVTKDPNSTVKHESFQKRYGEVLLLPLVHKNNDLKNNEQEDFSWRMIDSSADNNEELYKLLSRNIVALIKDKLKTYVPSKNRIAKPSDFFVLFQRRSELMYKLAEDLKASGIPVSGADKIEIMSTAQVKDIIALLKFVSFPYDDMNTAILLRSPFVAITEDDLFKICYNRGEKTVFENLKCVGYDEIYEKLNLWIKKSRDLTLYEFLIYIFWKESFFEVFELRFKGMTKKILEKFFMIAYEYEDDDENPPCIDSFLFWIKDRKVEIKKDSNDLDEVQLMTVHGSKGLEAPFVILADANYLDIKPDTIFFKNNVLIYNLNASNGIFKTLLREDKLKKKQEYWRLLYVAMTRAKDFLYVAGTESRIKNDDTWYKVIARNFQKFNYDEIQNDFWPETFDDLRKLENNENISQQNLDQKQSKILRITAENLFKEDFLKKNESLKEQPQVDYILAQNEFQEEFKIDENLKKIFEFQLPEEELQQEDNFDHNQDVNEEENLDNDLSLDLNEDFLQKLNENDFEKNEINIEFSRTYLGDIFHAAINVFHETKKLSEVRDFLRDQILDDRSLEKIFSLISEIVDQFKFLFTNASYSEIPFCLKYFEDGKKKFRNGRIDLLVENGNEILIVDYKFYTKSLIDDDIREQLRFYKNAMSKIYNGKVIKCFVLWVEDVSLVEVNI